MASVLLVEDRDDVRELIRDTIQTAGYMLDCASSWADGWRMLASKKHDLVVADVRLPDGSGRDLARRAISLGKRAVLITGHPNEVRRARPEIIYLRKPFLMRTLLRAIEQHVGLPEPVMPAPAMAALQAEPVTLPIGDVVQPILAEPAPHLTEAGPILLPADAEALVPDEPPAAVQVSAPAASLPQ
jgi:DNA-binding response OmpR family regulator